MQPLYNEFINFLEDKTNICLNLREGMYWIDNHAIKAFDKKGTSHTIYKYRVDDDLNVFIESKEDILEFETWEETVERNKLRIEIMAEDSIEFIQKTFQEYEGYDFFVLTSTGKDSTVVLDLVNRIKPIQVVFNNTSLDCAGTYKIAKSHKDWIITNPIEGFYQYIERMQYIPSKMSRGCCSLFKEGNHIEHFQNKINKAVWFMGIRNDESNKRADRKDYTVNPKWEGLNWIGCLPIRKWTEYMVWLYILQRNLEVNPKYKQGYRRCGCHVACPYQSEYSWVLDEYFYPNMRNRWTNILKENFIEREIWYKLNCTQSEYIKCWNGGIYREKPTDEVIQEFMNYKGITDVEIAKQYFNKRCEICNKNINDVNLIAMNLKMIGRDTKVFYCKNHLKKELKINDRQYDKLIGDFKSEGCSLF